MDGGLTALGGFLYQTVVALGLKAETYQHYQDVPPDKDDLETVLGFAKEGQVRYEDEDQDVSIQTMLHEQQPGYILVQIKYSRLSLPPPITKHALENIIKRLQASETSAHGRGHQVTGYSLLTSRPLNDDARQLAQTYQLPFHIVSSLPERFWESRLRQFAQLFSCTDDEIERGIRQGIGDLLQKVTNPHFYGEPIITKELLIELFTGCQQAHAVTPELAAKKSQEHLNKLFDMPFHLDTHPFVERLALQKDLNLLLYEHAFIVVSGVGGNGKTAVVWQWMNRAFQFKVPQRQRRYYHLYPSQWVQEDLFSHLFCTWANVPSLHRWHQQGAEQILDRLEIACTADAPSVSIDHPILILGLDAVDEAFRDGDQRALRNLLLWFWKQEKHRSQPPRATLIVTCRDSQELAEHWLNLSSPYEDEQNIFRNIELVVDTFSEEELLSAASAHLPAVLAERFELRHQAKEASEAFPLPLASGQAAHPLVFSSLELPPSKELFWEMEGAGIPQSMDADVFEALRHPTLWHSLQKIDTTVQARVLNGETEALGQLAMRFLVWFCSKARARGNRVQMKQMMEVLAVIAHHCDPHQSPRYKKKDWITHANSTPHMTHEMAARFFEEALSAGLIRDDERGWWRWRHPFIGEFLALQPLNEEDE